MNSRIAFIFINDQYKLLLILVLLLLIMELEKKKKNCHEWIFMSSILWYSDISRIIKMKRVPMKKEHLAHWTSHEICSRPKRKSDYLSHDAQVSLSFCSFVQISYKIPVSWIRSKTWYSKTCQQPYYWISNVLLSTIPSDG